MGIDGHFHKLVQYNNWANQRVLDAVEKIDTPQIWLMATLAHIALSEMNWYNRIQGKEQVDFWTAMPVLSIAKLMGENNDNWTNLLASLSQNGYEKQIQYVNTKGEKYSNSIWDILTHVVNHASYHRAQVALLLRQDGYEPPMTDYIVFVRE
ncbi:MAG: DinB family protein [candidate division Zixibacteria bacterium]|nr:DinB family protein [candidate division Zixibacteria bacterium]